MTFKFPEHKATENTERGKDHSRSRQVTRRDSRAGTVCVRAQGLLSAEGLADGTSEAADEGMRNDDEPSLAV